MLWAGRNGADAPVELRGIEPRSEPCKSPVLPLNYSPKYEALAREESNLQLRD